MLEGGEGGVEGCSCCVELFQKKDARATGSQVRIYWVGSLVVVLESY